MFESSRLKSALEKGKFRRERLALGGGLPEFLLAADDDRRPLRFAVVAAVVFHLVLFLVTFPAAETELPRLKQGNRAFVVRQVRFEPPPPKAQTAVPKKREKRKIIPVPDPTPDEPEPLRELDLDLPEVDALVDDDAIFGIPEGIVQGPGDLVGDLVPMDGNVVPPRKLFGPQPIYTEEARQARIQGVVILQAVVDVDGRLARIRVLKGLPEGLSESAVETVQKWRYEPATRGGLPVAVSYNLTISFSLQ